MSKTMPKDPQSPETNIDGSQGNLTFAGPGSNLFCREWRIFIKDKQKEAKTYKLIDKCIIGKRKSDKILRHVGSTWIKQLSLYVYAQRSGKILRNYRPSTISRWARVVPHCKSITADPKGQPAKVEAKISSWSWSSTVDKVGRSALCSPPRSKPSKQPWLRAVQGPVALLEPYSLEWVRRWKREGRGDSVPLQFGSNARSGAMILDTVTKYGQNESDFLFNVKEPRIYKKGYSLSHGHPGLFLAAFNKQKSKTKDLARFGYASLKATEKLSKQFLLTRQQALFGLDQVSLRNTALFNACPTKTPDPGLPSLCPAYSVMYRTLDGTCNNLDKPAWGAAYRPFARFLPPDYSDGIEALRVSVRAGDLPNPRITSATIHRPLNRPSLKITMMVMQWGQFLDHDLTATAQSRGFNHSVPKCCSEHDGTELPVAFRHPDCLPINIPTSDAFFSKWNHTCMEFVRSSPAPRADCALGPRDQINQVTSFIDASNVYGSDDQEMANLRLWETGMLKYKPVRFRKPLLPPLDNFLEGECRENSRNLHCFQAGDVRVNEQPALTSVHTVWLREHNRLVEKLAEVNPHWNDDRLFFESRKIIGAMMQKITYGEWLPTVLGPAVMKVFRLPLQRFGYYRGYKEDVNPQATNSFASAAFRFGHSLVQHTLMRCDKTGRRVPFTIKLHQELMNPSNIHNFGSVDRLILGLAFERAQNRDVYMTDELTRHLFQTPGHNYGMDLAAINIQRGRDHGLPSYNIWREQCGLHRFTNWGQLLEVMDDDTVGRLAAVYRHVDDIDLFPGGLAEKPVLRGLVGPTFACILGQQFLNLRRGDRFWFENGGFVSSLSPNQLREVRKVTMGRVICDNLDDIDNIQPAVFRPPSENGRNILTSCDDGEIKSMDLEAWREEDNSIFPGLQYSGISIHQGLIKNTSTDEFDDQHISDLPEEDLYDLDSEDYLFADEDEDDIFNKYSRELPRPFDDHDHDQKQQREDPGYFGHPGAGDGNMWQGANDNFNNMIEDAYGDTLFYG
ncbi:unnamed protein product, partial [Meganyctiphanes norvegica]